MLGSMAQTYVLYETILQPEEQRSKRSRPTLLMILIKTSVAMSQCEVRTYQVTTFEVTWSLPACAHVLVEAATPAIEGF
jgi:hypothetical protein